MTEEQKQALTGLCKIEIKRWKTASESNPNMRYMAELMEIALVALTAPPVKQPQTHDAHGFPEPAHILNSRWIEAIRAAGYQVEGE